MFLRRTQYKTGFYLEPLQMSGSTQRVLVLELRFSFRGKGHELLWWWIESEKRVSGKESVFFIWNSVFLNPNSTFQSGVEVPLIVCAATSALCYSSCISIKPGRNSWCVLRLKRKNKTKQWHQTFPTLLFHSERREILFLKEPLRGAYTLVRIHPGFCDLLYLEAVLSFV